MPGSRIHWKKDLSKRTICNVHREMYQLILKLPSSPEKIRLYECVNEAYQYGKKMGNKLIQYKFEYDQDWWDIHKHDGGELNELS